MSYILSLLAASFAAVVVELLAPRGEGGRLAASVRMCAGLFLLVALLGPLRAGVALLGSLADALPEFPTHEAPDRESERLAPVVALGEAALVEWVTETLSTEFSLPPDRVEVMCVWAESADGLPPLTELHIVLLGSAMLTDPHPIEAHFADALDIPCRVSVAVG